MRKAYTIMEMMVVVFVIAATLIFLGPVAKTLLTDVPQSFRTAQTHSKVLNLLDYMRKDITSATRIPRSFAGRTTDHTLLLLESPENVICYEFSGHEIARYIVPPAGRPEPQNVFLWSLPNASVNWRIRTTNEEPTAIEISTHVVQQTGGQQLEKMANSHVYFLNSQPEPVK